LPLGLGLCHLGRQEAIEAIVAALEVIPEPFKSMAVTMVEICAYAGTGNVLKIQQLLHICSEHYESSDREESRSEKSKEKSKDKDDRVRFECSNSFIS
jgi:26S proteasome regulatory subunit N1